MEQKQPACPDCDEGINLDRRDFLRSTVVGLGAAAAGLSVPLLATPRLDAAPTRKSAAETAVKALFETLSDKQRKEICFDWDYMDKTRGVLRTHVSNNWQITKPH